VARGAQAIEVLDIPKARVVGSGVRDDVIDMVRDTVARGTPRLLAQLTRT
jgi:hypothetical protein